LWLLGLRPRRFLLLSFSSSSSKWGRPPRHETLLQ
jgi:hypothetical protein